jgi:hypothetical protein
MENSNLNSSESISIDYFTVAFSVTPIHSQDSAMTLDTMHKLMQQAASDKSNRTVELSDGLMATLLDLTPAR